jgi:hypothetical protein
MSPRVLIENVKHKLFLEAFRKFLQAERAEVNLLFLFDKSNNEIRYHKFIRDGAPQGISLPDSIKKPLAALAAQKKWSAMGPGLREARKVIAAHTNDGSLPRFLASPAGRLPGFLLATGVDGAKARTMEALLRVFQTGRTPHDQQEAYAAMLKLTNKALLNPALRQLGLEPPPPVLRGRGDPSKALKLLGINGSQSAQMARLIADYAQARSKAHRASVLDQMEQLARGAVKDDMIVAALKSSHLWVED